MVPKVCVLLSTHNGAAFLGEQLESLAGQSYPGIAISVRDDGSTDGTRKILESHKAGDSFASVTFGERIGVVASFFDLLNNAGDKYEFYAFCDQDDVWSSGKIERAVARLYQTGPDVPALYCSRLEYVDRNLRHLGYSRIPVRGLSFEAALAENSATGCTIVLNRAARDMISRCPPEQCIMHDWWCYLVVAAFGDVIYDDEPGIRYRLHGGNDTGAAVSAWDDIRRRVRRFRNRGRDALRIHAQAQEFERLFGERLSDSRRMVLERFLLSKEGLGRRIRYALRPDIYRQTTVDNMLLRLLILSGWY